VASSGCSDGNASHWLAESQQQRHKKTKACHSLNYNGINNHTGRAQAHPFINFVSHFQISSTNNPNQQKTRTTANDYYQKTHISIHNIQAQQ
jgi:hypothetical protein